jgi:hypothetical protein
VGLTGPADEVQRQGQKIELVNDTAPDYSGIYRCRGTFNGDDYSLIVSLAQFQNDRTCYSITWTGVNSVYKGVGFHKDGMLCFSSWVHGKEGLANTGMAFMSKGENGHPRFVVDWMGLFPTKEGPAIAKKGSETWEFMAELE